MSTKKGPAKMNKVKTAAYKGAKKANEEDNAAILAEWNSIASDMDQRHAEISKSVRGKLDQKLDEFGRKVEASFQKENKEQTKEIVAEVKEYGGILVKELKGELTKLTGEITELKGEVKEHKEEIKVLNSSKATLRAKSEGHKKENATMNKDLSKAFDILDQHEEGKISDAAALAALKENYKATLLKSDLDVTDFDESPAVQGFRGKLNRTGNLKALQNKDKAKEKAKDKKAATSAVTSAASAAGSAVFKKFGKSK